MIIQIPAGFQPEVGQKQEFTITGEVQKVERDLSTGGFLVTLNITDPIMDSYPDGMPPVRKDRRITLREEMRGGRY